MNAILLAAVLAAQPYSSVLLEGVPHVEQRPDFCGEACAEMWLTRLGTPVTQDEIFTLSGVDPNKGRGLVTDELARTLRTLGFDVGPVWYHVNPANADEEIEAQWAALHADLAAGVPSIICGWSSDAPNRSEHMRLILGYDARTDEVIYHEPAEANGAYRRMPRAKFLSLWTFKSRRDRWTLIRMRLDRAAGARTIHPKDTHAAELVQHVMEVKDKAPSGSTVLIVDPFIVIGDEDPATVERRGRATVQWTLDRLRADFFAKDPDVLTDIWIFKNAASYEANSKALFHTTPDTPYGFYLEGQRALVMNIQPGYGTLVHELVHPYVHANCPTCPAWMNEGLASLYERPSDRDGHIVGLPNWRLPALQQALRARRVPTFRALTAMSDEDFYERDEGTNYAQARYLCYWLQEKGLLREFVAAMIARPASDPTGYAALSTVVGKDMDSLWKDWAEFTLALRVP